jgi:hypothetical protein
MAVSGVRDTEQDQPCVWDGLMFWGVQYRRLSLTELLRGVWFFALWAGLSAALLAPVLAQYKGGAGLYLLLGWVAALHLLARGWLERRLPDPSFAQDVRTGNFEQLRLAPLTAHGLLLQRGLPDLMFRATTQIVWLPVYAIAIGALGASLADACALWLLFSFANYFVLGLVSLAMLAPVGQGFEWVLSLALLGYAFLLDGGRVRTAVSSSSLFSVMLALPIVGRVLLPIQAMATLPNLLPFTLVWLLVEGLRLERLARWVNAPSGLWRGMYLLPSAGLMLFTVMATHASWSQMGLAGASLTQMAATTVFNVVGYLAVLLLTLRRQAEPIVQPLRAHLVETGLLRLVSVLLIGGAVAIWGLPMGSAAFWGVLAWLTVVEWLGGALTRLAVAAGAQPHAHGGVPRAAAGRRACSGVRVRAVPLRCRRAQPVYALVLASEAWATTRIAAQPPLWACLALPVARYALVLGVLTLMTLTARATQPTKRLHPAWGWLALPLLYPLLDWLTQRSTVNPITRLTIAERQPPFAPVIGLAVFALAFPLGNLGWEQLSGLVIIVLGLFLWLWGYYATAKRVRRWLDTGELASAFLAGLTPNQIFWGWVYGAWYQQLRVLLAAFGGWLLGVSLFVWLNAGKGGWNPVQWLTLWFSLGLAFYLAYLALWSCAWLIAAPAAIRDQLTHPAGSAPVLTPRATLQASVYSMLACCAPLAPFLLIGLPIYASQSTLALHRMARAPGELSRRYGIS